jgi:hypothetical protein
MITDICIFPAVLFTPAPALSDFKCLPALSSYLLPAAKGKPFPVSPETKRPEHKRFHLFYSVRMSHVNTHGMSHAPRIVQNMAGYLYLSAEKVPDFHNTDVIQKRRMMFWQG